MEGKFVQGLYILRISVAVRADAARAFGGSREVAISRVWDLGWSQRRTRSPHAATEL